MDPHTHPSDPSFPAPGPPHVPLPVAADAAVDSLLRMAREAGAAQAAQCARSLEVLRNGVVTYCELRDRLVGGAPAPVEGPEELVLGLQAMLLHAQPPELPYEAAAEDFRAAAGERGAHEPDRRGEIDALLVRGVASVMGVTTQSFVVAAEYDMQVLYLVRDAVSALLKASSAAATATLLGGAPGSGQTASAPSLRTAG